MLKLKAATFYFGLVFGVGFALGLIRVPLVVPYLGVRLSELLEMPLMFVAIVWAARFASNRFKVPPTIGARVSVGVLALCLLLVAELSVARFFAGQSPSSYVTGRDPLSGSVYALLLVVFALMPWMLVVVSRRGKALERRRDG